VSPPRGTGQRPAVAWDTAASGLREFARQWLPFEALPSQVIPGVPINVSFLVPQAHPSNQLVVERTVNGIERSPVRADSEGIDQATGGQRFRVQLPALMQGDMAEFRPVLSRAGLVLPSLPARTTRAVPPGRGGEVAQGRTPLAAEIPRCGWEPEYLGTAHVQLVDPPESIGPGPDGFRANFHVASGEIRGPKVNATITGTDYALIRRDGVLVSDTRLTLRTQDAATILVRYGGILDLGSDGYERWLRGESDSTPSFVLTPQFVASHSNWLWLNRLQCLAVGRAAMKELRTHFDVYAIRVDAPT
jgi:Protein of unknown function (DUF3237)